MTITSSGPICDVCDQYILLDTMETFAIKGIGETLHCHTKCRPIIEGVAIDNDWEKLPEGSIRRCFAAYTAKLKADEEQEESS